MTDYPEDIMKAARDIGNAWFGAGHHDGAALAADIAAALLAERKRCAIQMPEHVREMVADGWLFEWEPHTGYIAAKHPRGGLRSVLGISAHDFRDLGPIFASAIMGGGDE